LVNDAKVGKRMIGSFSTNFPIIGSREDDGMESSRRFSTMVKTFCPGQKNAVLVTFVTLVTL
jgi:hypothetical protein